MTAIASILLGAARIYLVTEPSSAIFTFDFLLVSALFGVLSGFWALIACLFSGRAVLSLSISRLISAAAFAAAIFSLTLEVDFPEADIPDLVVPVVVLGYSIVVCWLILRFLLRASNLAFKRDALKRAP